MIAKLARLKSREKFLSTQIFSGTLATMAFAPAGTAASADRNCATSASNRLHTGTIAAARTTQATTMIATNPFTS